MRMVVAMPTCDTCCIKSGLHTNLEHVKWFDLLQTSHKNKNRKLRQNIDLFESEVEKINKLFWPETYLPESS